MNMRQLISIAGLAAVFLLSGCERPPTDTVQHGYRGTGMVQVYNPATVEKQQEANQVPEATPQASPDGGGVVQHPLQGHRQGGVVAERHHRQGIPHEHRIGSGGLHQGCREGIPGREHRDRPAGLLEALKVGGAEGQGAVGAAPLLASRRLGPMRPRRPNLVRTGR